MKVLLSDDSKTIRMILRSLLQDLGVSEIQEAGNGSEALNYLATQRYDVILLDIHMPQMDGLEVLAALKTNPDSPHRETPVVIISSDTDYRQIEKAKELKAFGYIKKPFKKEGLEAAIGAARRIAARRLAEAATVAVAPEPSAAKAPAPVAPTGLPTPAPAPAPAPVPAARTVVPDSNADDAAEKPAKEASKGVFGWIRRLLQAN